MFYYHDLAAEDEVNGDPTLEGGVKGVYDAPASEIRGLEEDGVAGGVEEGGGEGVLRGIWRTDTEDVEPEAGVAVVGMGEEEGWEKWGGRRRRS